MLLVLTRCTSTLVPGHRFSADESRSAWDEIHDVFGDGTDFDWALDAQAETADADFEDETRKNLRLEDVSDK